MIDLHRHAHAAGTVPPQSLRDRVRDADIIVPVDTVATYRFDPSINMDQAGVMPAVSHPYEFGSLPMCDIIADKESCPFQRPLKEKHVREIMRKFDPLILDPLVVNVREHDMNAYLIRGQHRREALMRLFGQDVRAKCRIYYGLTPEMEAAVFVVEDTARKGSTPAERYFAGLDARHEPYVSVASTLRTTGWSIEGDGTKHSSHPPIKAINAVVTIATRHSIGVLSDTLCVLAEAKYTEEPPQEHVITGVAEFTAAYRKRLSQAQIVRLLQKVGYWRLMDRAEKRRGFERMTKRDAIRKQLEVEWNTGRKQEHRI
jgi:hypothetical protein